MNKLLKLTNYTNNKDAQLCLTSFIKDYLELISILLKNKEF